MPRLTSSAPKPRCVELASVFQNPLLEESMGSDATGPLAQIDYSDRCQRPRQGVVASAGAASSAPVISPPRTGDAGLPR